MDNFLFTKYRQTKIWKRAVVLFVLMALGIGGIGIGAHEALNNSQNACEAGNEVREGLRKEKETEIKFLEHLPNLFPGAPKGTFERYTQAQIHNIEHNKDTVFALKSC